MAIYEAPGTYVEEVDLSQVIANASSSAAALVGQASKGPVNERVLVTSVRQFLDTFGEAPVTGSSDYAHYMAKNFLAVGSQLYFTRVVGSSIPASTPENPLNDNGVSDYTVKEIAYDGNTIASRVDDDLIDGEGLILGPIGGTPGSYTFNNRFNPNGHPLGEDEGQYSIYSRNFYDFNTYFY